MPTGVAINGPTDDAGRPLSHSPGRNPAGTSASARTPSMTSRASDSVTGVRLPPGFVRTAGYRASQRASTTSLSPGHIPTSAKVVRPEHPPLASH